MKYVLIGLGIAVAAIILFNYIHNRRCIRNGICPMCGAKLRHFSNGNLTGLMCSECEWFTATDQDGHVY